MDNKPLLTQEQKISIENWVDASELTKIANLPDYDRLKANVGTKNEFKAFKYLSKINCIFFAKVY